MLDKLTRELPLGILFLLISIGLAANSSPNALAVLLVHIGVAGLAVRFFKRAVSLGNIIEVVQLAVGVLFSVYCAYVLHGVARVVAEPAFEFSVFTPEAIKRALLLNDFGIGVMLLVYGCHPAMQRPSRLLSSQLGESVFMSRISPQLFVFSFYLSWGIIIASVLFTPSVLQFPYPENLFEEGSIHPTFRVILILFPFALFLDKYVVDQLRTSFMGFVLRMTMYAAILGVGLLSGSRGAAVGLLIGLAALDGSLGRDATHWKWLFVSIDGLLAVFAVVNWPHMRVWMSDIGLIPAFIQSFSSYAFVFSGYSGSDAIFLSNFPVIGQSLFHLIYAIVLVDSGNSLHYQTFINLIPQQLPDFLDGILWVRPINDNWLLADQFRHGGGFYCFANAYWNGGILALGLFAAAIAWVIARIEIMFKTLPVYYGAAYFILILLVPVGFYYGIQGLVRGLEYGLIGCLLIRFAAQLCARSGVVHFKKSALQSSLGKSRAQ